VVSTGPTAVSCPAVPFPSFYPLGSDRGRGRFHFSFQDHRFPLSLVNYDISVFFSRNQWKVVRMFILRLRKKEKTEELGGRESLTLFGE